MGRARIISNIGIGLYTATPLYDTTALERELSELNAAATQYQTIITRAMLTRLSLIDDAQIARTAINTVLQQWKDKLIAKGNENPGPLTPPVPNDPETGLPWIDPDRAQEGPLFDAINAARTAASVGTVARDNDLDAACLAHLRNQAYSRRMGHSGAYGSTPSDRATANGYYRPTTIYELLAYGPATPAAVVNDWQKDPQTWANLISGSVINAGVAHIYASEHPCSYLWAVLLASAKSDPSSVEYETDPAKTAAEQTETELEKIRPPTIDKEEPDKLLDVVRKYALAQNKVIDAEKEIGRLMVEKLQRDSRITELESLQTELAAIVIHVWACYYNDELAPGNVIYTAEVPGFWQDEQTIETTTINGFLYQYEERSWNLVRISSQSGGQLKHAKTLLPATVFYNAAIESGHYLWKPKWRYGTITEITGNICTVVLESLTDRKLSREESFDLNQAETLADISINYPPCFNESGAMFIVGDEVLVNFVDQDQSKAEVIGFRREPKACPGKRISWEQIQ